MVRPLSRTLALVLALVGVLACGCSPTSAAPGSTLPTRMPMSSGAGGTFYVDGTGGSDTASGSSSAPWKTINKALATVPLSGSIIKVRPGTYTSVGTSYAILFNRKGNPADPVTLTAERPGTVLIRNGDPARTTLGAWIKDASGLRVQDINISMTANQANLSVNTALVENSDRIEFFRCTIHESGGFQVRGGKVEGAVSEDVWVLGSVFRPSGANVYAQATGNSHFSNTYAGSKGSHYVYAGQVGDTSLGFNYRSGAERFVVANNVFAGTAAGRHVELGPQARSSYVVNNTFFGNHAGEVIGWSTGAAYAGEGVVLYANTEASVPAATRDNIVANNLFVDMNGHAVYGSGPTESGNVVQKNLAWDIDNAKGYNGSATDDYLQNYGSSVLFSEGTGNFGSADPKLVAPLAYDFRLAATSPAIGKADPAYAPSFDITGQARVGAPDLGAFEQGAPSVGALLPVGLAPAGSSPQPAAGTTPSAPKQGAAGAAPKVRTAPRVYAAHGTLTCRRGTWSGAGPIRYSYRWVRKRGSRTSTIRKATAARYRLGRADVGARVSCRVTARNAAGARTAASGATRKIAVRQLRR